MTTRGIKNEEHMASSTLGVVLVGRYVVITSYPQMSVSSQAVAYFPLTQFPGEWAVFLDGCLTVLGDPDIFHPVILASIHRSRRGLEGHQIFLKASPGRCLHPSTRIHQSEPKHKLKLTARKIVK